MRKCVILLKEIRFEKNPDHSYFFGGDKKTSNQISRNPLVYSVFVNVIVLFAQVVISTCMIFPYSEDKMASIMSIN